MVCVCVVVVVVGVGVVLLFISMATRLTLTALGKICRRYIEIFFLIFSQETGFDNSCKLSPMEIIGMKCQPVFWGK